MVQILHVKAYDENDKLILDTVTLKVNSPELNALPKYRSCIELVNLCHGIYDINFCYGKMKRYIRYDAVEDALYTNCWIVKDIDDWFDDLKKVLAKNRIKKLLINDIVEFLKEARLDFNQSKRSCII